MRYTLLELVQRVLESMESDEVSSLGETPESLSVANIIKECYFDIIGFHAPDDTTGIFKLDASGDSTKPCLMYLPSTVSKLSWLKYDRSDNLLKPDWQEVSFVSNDEFIHFQTGIDQNDSTYQTMIVNVNDRDFTFQIQNERFPSYYTIFDEYSIVFNAFDAAQDNTLTENRTMGFGQIVPEFLMENDYVPDLDPRQFQLLLQEAKSTAFIELKQVPNPKAEAKARRGHIQMQKQRSDNDPSWPNQRHASFGRHGPMGSGGVSKRAMRMGR